jgi:hypothetical protein
MNTILEKHWAYHVKFLAHVEVNALINITCISQPIFSMVQPAAIVRNENPLGVIGIILLRH